MFFDNVSSLHQYNLFSLLENMRAELTKGRPSQCAGEDGGEERESVWTYEISVTESMFPEKSVIQNTLNR